MNETRAGTDTIELPAGFRAAGWHAGIKKSNRKDMALIVADAPATVAGVFTQNKVCAAPVKWCRQQLTGRRARAIIVNSGNANCCTGPQGVRDTETMAQVTAAALDVPVEQVFVCSTGSIGFPLPMAAVTAGIPALAQQLSRTGGRDAAEAIMTTDLKIKHWTAHLQIEGHPVTVSGIAKGAGMIEPNMATMLSFCMTDAAVDANALQQALHEAVDQSFNRITVDGDQSTNDTVLLLASGVAGHPTPLTPAHPDWRRFVAALKEVTLELALKIVADGEGANKVITVLVEGAASDADADRAARAIANSFLVKTSWAGAHAIWGRIMETMGYSGAQILEERVDIWYDDLHAVHQGVSTGAERAALERVIARPTFTLCADLHLGTGRAVVYTCEITEEYVRINVE
jgi:glutamate N-acetyltransferase / amino-acid N-acetyltransferase